VVRRVDRWVVSLSLTRLCRLTEVGEGVHLKFLSRRGHQLLRLNPQRIAHSSKHEDDQDTLLGPPPAR
jgi:hypothetical protein